MHGLLALAATRLCVVAAIAPSHTPLPLGAATYGGELGTRYQAATANLLTRPERYPVSSFRSNITGEPGALWTGWPGDQLGRWYSVLHVAEAYGWTPAARNRAEIAEVALPLQNEHGDFGPLLPLDQTDGRVPSGNAFALRGLVDAYRDTGEQRYLEAARRLARYFEAAAPSWREAESGGLHCFYGHCLDGLVALYEEVGDGWVLALARDLASHAGRAGHTHHALSMYRGVLDLYRVTGEARYLARAEDYLAWCSENRTVSGGLPEAMPASGQDEGCGLADYVIVNLMAYSLTGKETYLDDAERTLVNHLSMNQFHTGGFGHRAFGQEILGGKEWQGWDGEFGSENPGCCSLWGQWALGTLGSYIVTTSGDTLEVNLYPCATVHVPAPDVRLEIVSDYPRMGHARVTVLARPGEEFALALRVPAWAEGLVASCGGTEYVGRPGQRVVIRRHWQAGDAVELRFPSRLRAVRWPDASASAFGVYDGPLCLGLSSEGGDVERFAYVPLRRSGNPIDDGTGHVRPLDEAGERAEGVLAPIGEGWLNPDVKAPHRIRVLFVPWETALR